MSSVYANPNVTALAERWWALVIRGAAALLLGIVAVATPEIDLLALVVCWSAYALADGVLALMMAGRRARAGRRWGWLLFEGGVSTVAGALTLFWPGITSVVLLIVIAMRAVLTGIAEIATAMRLRHQLRDEWLLDTSGVLSIVLGVVLLMFPRSGALAFLWMIGAYAIGFGVLLVGLGLRLRRWDRSLTTMAFSGTRPATR